MKQKQAMEFTIKALQQQVDESALLISKAKNLPAEKIEYVKHVHTVNTLKLVDLMVQYQTIYN